MRGRGRPLRRRRRHRTTRTGKLKNLKRSHSHKPVTWPQLSGCSVTRMSAARTRKLEKAPGAETDKEMQKMQTTLHHSNCLFKCAGHSSCVQTRTGRPARARHQAASSVTVAVPVPAGPGLVTARPRLTRRPGPSPTRMPTAIHPSHASFSSLIRHRRSIGSLRPGRPVGDSEPRVAVSPRSGLRLVRDRDGNLPGPGRDPGQISHPAAGAPRLLRV